jgi:hypothetical protein
VLIATAVPTQATEEEQRWTTPRPPRPSGQVRSLPMTLGGVLTHVSPDTDDSLPHLGVVGDTYTILVSGADTAGR